MATASSRRSLWQPPAETLEAFAAVLRKHWHAAARSRSARLFWATPARWLEVGDELTAPLRVNPWAPVRVGTARVTTSRSAAD
jgi:hypothetical protein